MGEKTTVEIDDIMALKQHALDTNKTMKQIINEAIAEKIKKEQLAPNRRQKMQKGKKKDLDAEIAAFFKEKKISPEADLAYKALKKEHGIAGSIEQKNLTQGFIGSLTEKLAPLYGETLGAELGEKLKSLKR